MSLLTRQQTILAKVESSYGVDPVPTGGANAILAKNFAPTPMQAEQVSRDLIKPYFGNSEQLLAQYYMQLGFEVEYVGSGIVGGAPGFDSLLRACGFTKSQVLSPITSITRTGTTATATKAGHGYSVGEKRIITGADQTEYNGTITITAVTTNTFSFEVAGSPVTPATGTLEIVTSLEYVPVSSLDESVTLYYYVGDGTNAVLHKCTGAKGTVEISLSVKTIPVFKFNFTGLYNDPTDVSSPAGVDFSSFQIPQITNTQNTPAYSLYGYTGKLESFSLNMANDIQYITLIGQESVKFLDRKPAGSMVFEAPTIGTKDFFTIVKNSQTGVLGLTHGTQKGKIVTLSAPRVLMGNPSYQDSNSIKMLSAPFTLTPVNGNDEIKIAFS
jgi:hypothetical protein